MGGGGRGIYRAESQDGGVACRMAAAPHSPDPVTPPTTPSLSLLGQVTARSLTWGLGGRVPSHWLSEGYGRRED